LAGAVAMVMFPVNPKLSSSPDERFALTEGAASSPRLEG
jgi:hypothetical protein